MKKILIFMLVLAGVGVSMVYVELGSIVKNAVESRAPAMLGAPVSIGLVTLSPFTGKCIVRGLKVGNPEGFRSASAIEVGEIRVSLDVRSLFGRGRILIRQIDVDAPKITLETGLGGTNLQQLQRNLEAAAPNGPDTGGKAQLPPRKIEIALFRLTGAQATAVVPQMQSAPLAAVTLPTVELKGIGAQNGGASESEAARQILSAVTQSALSASGGPEALIKKALQSVGAGGTDPSKVLNQLQDFFKKK
jgi:hypothetical protein